MGGNGSEAFEVAAVLLKPQGYKRRQWYSRRYRSGHQSPRPFIDGVVRTWPYTGTACKMHEVLQPMQAATSCVPRSWR